MVINNATSPQELFFLIPKPGTLRCVDYGSELGFLDSSVIEGLDLYEITRKKITDVTREE